MADPLLDVQSLSVAFEGPSHGLRLVEHICNRVAVMYSGRIVEIGDTTPLFANPTHPYTCALLSAVPVLDPDAPRRRVTLDPAAFDRNAPLKEIGPMHWAAV